MPVKGYVRVGKFAHGFVYWFTTAEGKLVAHGFEEDLREAKAKVRAAVVRWETNE